jgi:UDP:flavonoid glycosyltransferase YjiC (YdhE family)
MGRDQDATAASVVNQRAGVELSPTASSDEIRLAIADLLDDDGYRENAARLASVLAREHQALDVVLELEDLVGPAAPGTV